MSTSDNSHTPNNDTWTSYQKLIMAELARHDSHIEEIKESLTDIRVELTKLAIELQQGTANGAALATRIGNNEKVTNAQDVDVTLLKYKIGMMATAISTGLTIAVEFIIKILDGTK